MRSSSTSWYDQFTLGFLNADRVDWTMASRYGKSGSGGSNGRIDGFFGWIEMSYCEEFPRAAAVCNGRTSVVSVLQVPINCAR